MGQGLDVCDAIGATQMVIYSPHATWDHNNMDGLDGARDRLIENTHAALDAAVRRAGDQGITLVVENIENVDPSDRRCLVESFGSDAIRLSIDTGHAHYAHGSNGARPSTISCTPPPGCCTTSTFRTPTGTGPSA